MQKKTLLAVVVSSIIFSLVVCQNVFSQEYQHSLVSDKMTFDWSVEQDMLAIKLSAPTKGWVAIGFNPSNQMKDANIIIGYVKNGEVSILDEFGTHPVRHGRDSKIGGIDNVTVVGGTEEGRTTTLEFKIPIQSDDKFDSSLDVNGDTTVILAYGPDRDSMRMKHAYNVTKIINLSTGEVKQ
jgi:hypothetical protein